MSTNQDNVVFTPKIFISYSWSSNEHKDWVKNLAERLVSDGVDVSIDIWSLKHGNDMNTFMESMVTSTEIEKVLIILDKIYSEKANNRKGGVGIEAQIISPEIYKNVSQEKFIPLIKEKDEHGVPYVPAFLNGRFSIDFSESNSYEQSYEELLRNLYKRPTNSKPKIGKPPSYLFEESKLHFETKRTSREFENIIKNHPELANSIAISTLDEFFENLKEFKISITNMDSILIGKMIIDGIVNYTPLRNEIITFFNNYISLDFNIDIDNIIGFFEKLSELNFPQQNQGSWYDVEFDIYRFITMELFIYLIALCLKHRKYKLIGDIFHSTYFVYDKHRRPNVNPEDFTIFYQYIESLDGAYEKIYSHNSPCPMAELMINRIHELVSVDLFVQADYLCFYIAELNKKDWFPITYTFGNNRMEIFERINSEKYFDKIKYIFNVQSREELIKILKDYFEAISRRRILKHINSLKNVIPLNKFISIEKISTLR